MLRDHILKDSLRGVTVILRSCLTGRPVWIYTGPSEEAAAKAYRRACKREMKRVRRWAGIAARRKASVMAMIGALTEGLPSPKDMQPAQRAAVRLLTSASEAPPCSREFYDHIMEERRRRERDRKVRRQMREREIHGNRDYDK